MISFCQEKKTLRARSEEREERLDSFSERFVPHGKIPAIRRTIHPFAASSNAERAFAED
jgi:hypothetical protein